MFRLFLRLAAAAALSCSASVYAATPASGDLTDTSGPVTFTGGPFVFPNVTPFGHSNGTPLACNAQLAQATICDIFTVNVAIPEKFRKNEKNRKEIVQILLSFAAAEDPLTAQADFDMYLFDPAGTQIGDSATGANPEIISMPLSAFKDSSYTVQIFPFLPLGGSYSGEVHIGKTKKSGSKDKELSIDPMVAAANETIRFDAHTLSGDVAPAGGYQFSFGDGQSITDADGVIEHRYTSDGNYLARVSFTDPNGTKGTASAAQTIVVDSSVASVGGTVSSKEGSGLTLGAFGIPALFSLFGLALLRRRV